VRLIREIIWLVSYASYIKSPDYSKPGNRGWGERWVGQLFDWCCPRADESALDPPGVIRTLPPESESENNEIFDTFAKIN
jgi:hypothetical protein